MVHALTMNVCAVHLCNWEEYLASLWEMMPWLLIYDKTNYGRWLPHFWAMLSDLPAEQTQFVRSLNQCSATRTNPFLRTCGLRWPWTRATRWLATGLRELLLACEKYSKEHAIIYNSKKSSVLICKNRATLHVPSPSFAVSDIAIGEVAKVKYLGHVITNDMTDDADMMRQRRQLYALGNVLSRRFHMCSIEVKNTLFRSFCTPMYTCQLWWNFSVQSMHKLNVAYNNAFRFMHHLPTYCSASLMFVVNRVPNCRAVIRNRIYGFMKRLVSSSNALVLSTVTSDARFRSRIVRHWLKSLYIHFDAGWDCMYAVNSVITTVVSIIMLVSGYNIIA